MKTSILPTMALALQVDWLDAYEAGAGSAAKCADRPSCGIESQHHYPIQRPQNRGDDAGNHSNVKTSARRIHETLFPEEKARHGFRALD